MFKRKKQESSLEATEEKGMEQTNEKISNLEYKTEAMDAETLQRYGQHYSENRLWQKIKKYAKKAGSSAVYVVLLLYYVLQKKEVPKKSKAIIIGALGYFILPLDLIPDFVAAVGYTDDLGALLAALWQVSMYIDEEVKSQAREKLKGWFGEGVDTSDVDLKLE